MSRACPPVISKYTDHLKKKIAKYEAKVEFYKRKLEEENSRIENK